MENVELISAEFSKILNNWLTPEEIEGVNLKNKTDEYIKQGFCATHEHCDPNEAMIQALSKYGFEFDPQDERQMKLINKAWALSKQREFKVL